MVDEATVRSVLFADLSGFTALTEAHGDGAAADVAGRFTSLAASVIGDGARVVKTIGDAVMVVTPDGRSGLEAGVALLHSVDDEPAFPGVRIGVHLGPVVERAGDLFGATVNLAARLAGHARVGQALVTAPIAALVNPEDSVRLSRLGPTHLKNISQPVELFSIEDACREPLAQVMDPVCRMFVDADEAPAQLPWADRVWRFCSFDCARVFSEAPDRYVARGGTT
jgi:class 3 adenylate cyclase/YHS domain-containing protein